MNSNLQKFKKKKLKQRPPLVFVSHSSEDKKFVTELVYRLNDFGINVWFDAIEIAVGDSIVEKIFNALEITKSLLVVLSPASVKSRWVKEELNTINMSRISEGNVRVIPIMIKTCRIPIALKHIKYADFRDNFESGILGLIDALAPDYFLWKSLEHRYLLFIELITRVKADRSDEAMLNALDNLYSYMDSALEIRCQIVHKRHNTPSYYSNIYQKIGELGSLGLDIRNEAWHNLVVMRSLYTHYGMNEASNLYHRGEIELADSLTGGYGFGERPDKKEFQRLSTIFRTNSEKLIQAMKKLCFPEVSN